MAISSKRRPVEKAYDLIAGHLTGRSHRQPILTKVLTSSPRTVRLRRSDPPRRAIAVEITAPAAPAANPTTVSPPAVNPPAVAVSKPMPNPPAAKKVNVAEHPLAQHALMALRNKHTAPAQFRRISNQLLVLLAIEATRSLPTRDDLVETATGAEVTSPPWPRSPNARDDAAKSHSTTHTGQVLAKPVVLLSLTRHGLGLAHNLTDLIPDLLVGTISLDRTGDNPGAEPRLHLINAPALGDARVILFDPVVATGASASQALNFLRRSGANDITLVSFLVSFLGLSRVQTTLPDLAVWTAGIDNEWDSKRGSLAGLGNFGARLYG